MSNTAGAVRLAKLGEMVGLFQGLVGTREVGLCEKGRGGESLINCVSNMCEDLYYSMDRRRVGTAVIINNLDLEQPPTKNDVENMGAVLQDIGKHLDNNLSEPLSPLFLGFEIHVNLTSQPRDEHCQEKSD